MTEEIRTVYIGAQTVEVEVDPEEFKRPALMWIPLLVIGSVIFATGYHLLGIAILLGSGATIVSNRMQAKARMEIAVREAAFNSIHRYEQSRIVGWKSLG